MLGDVCGVWQLTCKTGANEPSCQQRIAASAARGRLGQVFPRDNTGGTPLFFAGKPHWTDTTGHHTSHPFSYCRKAQPVTGGLSWVDGNDNEVLGTDGGRLWNT